MFDLFGAAKLGRMRLAAFVSSGGSQYQLVPRTQGEKSLYMLRPTVDCYVIQGSNESAIDVNVTSLTGTRLAAGFYFPLLVEDLADESFIAIRGVSADGNLEITLISDVFRDTTWTLVEI